MCLFQLLAWVIVLILPFLFYFVICYLCVNCAFCRSNNAMVQPDQQLWKEHLRQCFQPAQTTGDDTKEWKTTRVCMCCYLQDNKKHLTCNLFSQPYSDNSRNRWLVFGDFNLVLCQAEKNGGNPIDSSITNQFRDTIQQCDFNDLGYIGDIFII